MPTRYSIQAKVYSGVLWRRGCISSAPIPSPSGNCLLDRVVEFSSIQHHVQDKKMGFSAACSLNKIGYFRSD